MDSVVCRFSKVYQGDRQLKSALHLNWIVSFVGERIPDCVEGEPIQLPSSCIKVSDGGSETLQFRNHVDSTETCRYQRSFRRVGVTFGCCSWCCRTNLRVD